MIATATTSLRAEFVDAAIHHDGELDRAAGPTNMADAIDAALPDGEHSWESEPDYVGDTTNLPRPIDPGTDPY